ncbi:MAG: tRNA (adenosine(37)-N6)-dimethylallyltransferase MiaA [Gammaproteobacteria bacterium]|nr:tRNA (adenosine(37)-N6)-dimethylallyltransferase MiaA [Gammaproteobacteria bacterium]
MGATATGKTALTVDIADRFPIEVISVDSAQIYRQMDIGTAKPEAEIRARLPHHLIDILDPAEAWSVWEFVHRSRRLIDDIRARGRMPVMAGGSMLYFHAFEQGLNALPEADVELRRRIEREAEELGWPALHARLGDIDAETAARIEPGDSQRIQRALEVYALTGQPLSRLQREARQAWAEPVHKIVLATDERAELHRRIERRFHQMLEDGLIEEVAALHRRGDLDPSMPSIRCVGYRQAWRFLDGEIDRAEMIERAIAATRQLAKRQITWLRRQPAAAAVDCLNLRKDDIFRRVEASLGKA